MYFYDLMSEEMSRLFTLMLSALLTSVSATEIDSILLKNSHASIQKGLKFLLKKQAKNGSWGPHGNEAISAIGVSSLIKPNANGESQRSKAQYYE